MRLRRLTVLVALTLAVTACTAKQEAPASAGGAGSNGPAVAVLVDISGSARIAESRYVADFHRVLASFEGGEHLYTFSINANSRVSPIAFDMDFRTGQGNAYTRKVELKRLDREASQKFTDFMNAERPKLPGSAIIDGVRHAADVLAKRPADQEKVVVILSDMIEQSELHDFTGLDEATAGALVQRLQTGGQLPDLKGARVYVAGITDAGGSLSAARVQAIRRFWEQFFEAAGAQLQWYGPSLVDFRPRA